MGRIVLFVLVLLLAASSPHADEMSVAGGAATRCRTCVTPDRPEEPLPPPAIGPSVFVLAGPARTGVGNAGFFPVLPRGQRQFAVGSSKLRGPRFRWHAL